MTPYHSQSLVRNIGNPDMQLQTMNFRRITTQMLLAREFYSSMPIICTAMQWVSPFQREILNFCLQNKSKNLICQKQHLLTTLDSFSKSILSISYISMSHIMIIPCCWKGEDHTWYALSLFSIINQQTQFDRKTCAKSKRQDKVCSTLRKLDVVPGTGNGNC